MKLAFKHSIAAILLMLSFAVPVAAGPVAWSWFFEKPLDWSNRPTRFAGAFVILIGFSLTVFLLWRLLLSIMRRFVHLT